MNKSIHLLSSMSPKVKTKAYAKGSSMLALKRNIRRSSNCDKSFRTASNEEVFMLDKSTSTSSLQTDTSDGRQNLIKDIPIVISDTSSESEDENTKPKIPEPETPKDSTKIKTVNPKDQIEQPKTPVQHITPEPAQRIIRPLYWLSEEKLKDINQWVENISLEPVEETTTFSELLAIGGDGGIVFVPKEGGEADSPSFISPQYKSFDECFKELEKKIEDLPSSISETEEQLQKVEIEDSFEVSTNSFKVSPRSDIPNKNVPKNVSEEHVKTEIPLNNFAPLKNVEVDESCSYLVNDLLTVTTKETILSVRASIDNIKAIRKSVEPRIQQPPVGTPRNTNEEEHDDISSVLDSIYGSSWRHKEDQILPKTEPRKTRPQINVTHSERKILFPTLFGNPLPKPQPIYPSSYFRDLLTEGYVHEVRRSRTSEFCHTDISDSPPDSSLPIKPRAIFDDNSFRNAENGEVEFTNNDQKQDDFDVSDLGVSLEERIRKKINKIPDLPSSSTRKKSKARKKLNKVEAKKDDVSEDRDVRRKKTVKKKPKRKMKIDSSESSVESISSDNEEEWNRRISTITYKEPTTGTYSFLASLSKIVPVSKSDMSARIYRNNFKDFKNQLITKLFSLYNEKVFNNALPDDIPFEWNDRMRGTAGFCYCRKVTYKDGRIERTVRIVLANKVVDSADRLRDTLIHELCHAASWIVNNVSDGHGKYWQSWAFKAMKTFPELPVIKRCHDYIVNTKYTYKCTGCGYSIGRHTKSLDIERKRCGYCLFKFEVLVNKVSRKGVVHSVPATPKKEPVGFALFVKENYSAVKRKDLRHGDVMQILSLMFKDLKINKQ